MIEVIHDEVLVNGRSVARIEWDKTTTASEQAVVERLCREEPDDIDQAYYDDGYEDGVESAWNTAKENLRTAIEGAGFGKRTSEKLMQMLEDL